VGAVRDPAHVGPLAAAGADGVLLDLMTAARGEMQAVMSSADAESADAHLRSTPLGWTIIRLDALTEDPPSGRVRLGAAVPHGACPGPTWQR